jgi:hypothetical protein
VTGPTPSPEPAAGVPAEAEDDTPADAAADTEAPPANRAERRARKGGQPPTPREAPRPAAGQPPCEGRPGCAVLLGPDPVTV